MLLCAAVNLLRHNSDSFRFTEDDITCGAHSQNVTVCADTRPTLLAIVRRYNDVISYRPTCRPVCQEHRYCIGGLWRPTLTANNVGS